MQTSVFKYIIPADDLTEAKKQQARDMAIAAALERARKTRCITSDAEALVRAPEPVTDFGMAAGGWLSAAHAVVGTAVSIFNALTPALANNRVVVFYGFWYESIPLASNLLSFREGAAAGSTYAVFELEELASTMQTRGYFSEPIWYDPQRVMNVVVTPRIVAGVQRMGLMGFVIEPRGPVVSA
jgi:hypothetical protein